MNSGTATLPAAGAKLPAAHHWAIVIYSFLIVAAVGTLAVGIIQPAYLIIGLLSGVQLAGALRASRWRGHYWLGVTLLGVMAADGVAGLARIAAGDLSHQMLTPMEWATTLIRTVMVLVFYFYTFGRPSRAFYGFGK